MADINFAVPEASVADVELENLLKNINEVHWIKHGHNEMIIFDYVGVAMSARVEAPLKLRLLAHLMAPPNQELLDHRYSDHPIDQIITMLQEKYRKVYTQWWRAFVKEIRADCCEEVPAMLARFAELRNTYPEVMHFRGIVLRDFLLSIDSLIQELNRSEELRKSRLRKRLETVVATPELDRDKINSNQIDGIEEEGPEPRRNLIPWDGNDVDLLFTFEVLHAIKMISASTFENRFELIAEHFADKDGNLFDAELLRQGDRNYRNNKNGPRPRNGRKIEKSLIEALSPVEEAS